MPAGANSSKAASIADSKRASTKGGKRAASTLIAPPPSKGGGKGGKKGGTSKAKAAAGKGAQRKQIAAGPPRDAVAADEPVAKKAKSCTISLAKVKIGDECECLICSGSSKDSLGKQSISKL